ncbi:nuclear factor 7, brain-like [Alosa sapidissima]|uniref:nuclear factor 7, brain-like n=1 Tax=Alosa sapidissima TaxID=34773 RepID=UPI001C09F758|nr:nuclear factor 7, brain-like [Alosa sapidissima]
MKRKHHAAHKGRNFTSKSVKSVRANDEHKPRIDNQSCYPDENLTCTICYAIFTDPVTLKCSHSFCQECLHQYWKDLDVSLCPICRRECSTEEPTLSLAFKSLCESVKRHNRAGHSDQLCPLHGERLKLFCFEDEQPICVICYTSKMHKNHACSPIEETVLDLKREMRDGISTFHQSLKILQQTKNDLQNTATQIQNQAQYSEVQIIQEFEKLHHVLRKEEEAKLLALREEKEQLCRHVENRIKKVYGEIATLLETIDTVKREMESNHILFLQKYYSNAYRLKCTTPESEDLSGALMDKHICSLNHKLLLPSFYSDGTMTLDPNTASPKLIIADHLTSLTYTEEKQTVHDNPERFQIGVLGSKGFTAGRHSWDVEVGDNDNWTLGVVRQSIKRKQLLKMQPVSGLWSIRFISGKYRAGVKARTELKVAERPTVIRVLLDYERGEVSFSDPSANMSLYSFTDVFTEEMYPYFNSTSLKCPLRLFPLTA